MVDTPLERQFTYRAVRASGEVVSAGVRAPDEAEALRRLAREGLTVTDISAAGGAGKTGALKRSDATERALVLRQLAVMSKAGVELLESLDSVASALSGRQIAAELEKAAAGLRRGEPVARAFETALTGFPPYVFALIAAGEASGRLDAVLAQAAEELAYEDRVRRELSGALAYPAFLVAAGIGAMTFLFLFVVPRFASMVGDRAQELGGLPGFVLGLANVSPTDAGLVALSLVVAALALFRTSQTPNGRRALIGVLEKTPAIGSLWVSSQRARWARVMAFALEGGVGILQSASLAEAATPAGRFRDGLANATRALRAGKPVDASFGEEGALAAIDVSLLRAGQRSGALPAMFRAIAERHEADLKGALKRVSVILEQGAIALVAVAVGIVVLSLVSAMTGVYETIG